MAKRLSLTENEVLLKDQRSLRCGKCRKVLGLENFHKDSTSWSGYSGTCKSCVCKYQVGYRQKYHARLREKKRASYYLKNPLQRYLLGAQKMYGITPVEYAELYIKQDGRCAICLDKPIQRLAIDHDHQTGKVRGLLCIKCNRALGLVADSSSILKYAIAYLENSRA